jgi:ATP-binding cassette subfamily B protein
MAIALGLDAEQIMLPADHISLASTQALPALAVVRRENMTHFLVAWRRHGPIVQLMDPAKGRRWLTAAAFRDELFIHEQRVAAPDWRAWAGTPEFLDALDERLRMLDIAPVDRRRAIDGAAADATSASLATLDAAVRMIADLVRGGGLRAGREASLAIRSVVSRAAAGVEPLTLVPAAYWSARPLEGAVGDGHVMLRGAVLLRVRQTQPSTATAPATTATPEEASARAPLPAGLAEAVNASPPRPFAALWEFIRRDSAWGPSLIALALILAAAGAIVETVLFRGLLEIDTILTLREHRLIAAGIVLLFAAALFWLDFAIAGGVLWSGRRLEARLRSAFFRKLPRLGERYFSSRLVSDVAQRAHSLDALRTLPEIGGRFARVSMQLVFTAAAVAWLDPASAWLACLGAVLALAIPLASAKMLAERELRQRVHSAALSRHYLDSLLGLTAARTHGAERSLRRRHESLLIEWGRSSVHWLRGSVVIEGVQLLTASAIAAWLVLDFAARGGRTGATLLLVYWVLNLPLLGRELAGIIRRLPSYRNILVRVLEILQAPEEADVPEAIEAATTGRDSGAAVAFRSVEVRLGGQPVLRDVDLDIPSGQHVAIVGRSGAGKSTLAGLLLGWHAPSAGRVLVDGAPFEGAARSALRRSTAWVDPAVQLWNRSLFDNLRYSDPAAVISSIGAVIDAAELRDILESLPDSLQSPLGEGGGLTSGGEGQRIRFARALVGSMPRLAVLDEPFRGLDRVRRRRLLERAREIWRDATLVCVTHDIDDTRGFERVLVVDEGRVVEDGKPSELAATPGSQYAKLLAAERKVQSDLWSSVRWKRWRLVDGAIEQQPTAVVKGEAEWTISEGSSGR